MSQLRFLFLEDNPTDVELIIYELNNSGFKFDRKLVDNKEDFLEALKTFKPDIIFSDFSLPNYNGLEAIIEVKINYPDIPLIIVTGAINEETAVDCMKAGASDYILKDKLTKLGISTKLALEMAQLKKENINANELLKKNEYSHKILIEQAGDAIFTGNIQGDFIQVNSAASKLTGFSKKELLSMNMKDVFSKPQLDIKPLQYNALNRGEPVINEREIFTKEGNFVPVEMNSKKIDENSYLSIIRDLSERKKIEKDLKDREEKLKNIIEHTSNMFFMQTSDSKFTYISPQSKQFLDCEPEKIIDKQISFITDNPVNKIGKEITQKAIQTGKKQPPFELELIGKKGKKIWVEVHEAPVIRKGKVTGIVGALVDITNWKEAYSALVVNEKKFKKLFSEAPDGILLINAKGIITDCNKAYCNLLETNDDEIINSHIKDSIYDLEKASFKERFSTLIKTGKIAGEISLKTKQNKIIKVSLSASALYNDSNEFIGAIVHTHDITEQTKIQDEINKREARLSAIFKAADNVSFILSTIEGEESKILEFSPGSEKLFGYTKNEVIGKPVKILHTRDMVNNFSKYLDKMKKSEEGFKGQTTMITKTGRKLSVLHTAYPVFDNKGKLSQALGVTLDISKVLEIEETLKKREEQLTTLINSSPDFICFKDGDGKWQLANDTDIKLFQLEGVDYFDKTDAELAPYSKFYEEAFSKHIDSDEIAWKKGIMSKDEEIIQTPDGNSKVFDVIKIPLFHPNGDRKAIVILGRDITERKQMETQLRQSHKMEAIGLLASGIAHNFNNILQAIVGYIDFAKEGLKETEQRYKDIHQIGKLVKRATQLTKNLLAVGKEQFMEKRDVDLNDIIVPIVELTNRATRNNIIVKFHRQENIPPVYVDGSQIDQVIMNIFINARDAMPSGGIITVNTQNVEINKTFCSKNTWAKPGNYILIKISDTGHGMDSDTKRRIFEPYFTTKGIDKGTGLGLSTAFGIISQHNGLLNVISEKDKGSTFEIYLPFS